MHLRGFCLVPRARSRAIRILASATLAGAFVLMKNDNLRAQAAEGVAAWRVECTGDGKTLECRAVQQLFQRETRQLVVAVTARYDPTAKAAAMSILLPLGINLTEPVLIKVDNGAPERQPIQTCNNGGCIVAMTANDKLLASMRTGSELKIAVQDASKKPVEMTLPLLGFGIAYDKTK